MSIVFLYGAADLYGASQVLITDVRRLVSNGTDVVVVLPFTGPLVPELQSAGASIEIDRDLHVIRRQELKTWRPVARRLSSTLACADQVVLWTLALAAYGPALAARRLPFGVSIHELLPGIRGAALVTAATTGARWVHVNSLAVREWAGNFAPRDRLYFAYPQAPSPRTPRQAGPDTSGPLRLVLAGRTNGRKGHLEAVHAVAPLVDDGLKIELSLYGDPFPGQEMHLDAVLKAIDDRPWATYHGGYSGSGERPTNYDLLLVLPQVVESFGLGPLEAWAHGIRAFGIGRGGLREALALTDGVLVKDSSQISDGLRWVENHREILRPPRADAPVAKLCSATARDWLWERTLAA